MIQHSKIRIDTQVLHQRIEGFGFFGAQNTWWSGQEPSSFYSERFLRQALVDLGITMWRNEIYPNVPVESDISSEPQSGNWAKQRDCVVALADRARQLNVDLKILLSVWSPPGEWKVEANDLVNNPDEGQTRDVPYHRTKEGGTLSPEHYEDYANWLIQALDMYEAAGVSVYGLSLQNEPMFLEPYNSCVYTAQWYVQLLNHVIPIIRGKHPSVKIFGSENMLQLESEGEFERFRYHEAILKDQQALANIDAFAVHGYYDGVRAVAIDRHKALWEISKQKYGQPTGKPHWMTETSSFVDPWNGADGLAGAFDLGIAIHSALACGDVTAWVWWQGCEYINEKNSEFVLTGAKGCVGKRFYVSKHFYRFIRPGANRVQCDGADGLMVSAYRHEALDNHVIVLLNPSDQDRYVSFEGKGLPEEYEFFLTTEGESDNCRPCGVVPKADIRIPGNAIVTLVNGPYIE